MKLIHRIGYYLGGFSIGLILLAFFLSGKRASCNYGPQSRVLKNISTKQLVYSQNAIEFIKNRSIDSLTIIDIIHNGSVNFSKSKTNLDSCNIYVIEKAVYDREISMTVVNCETEATIQSISSD